MRYTTSREGRKTPSRWRSSSRARSVSAFVIRDPSPVPKDRVVVTTSCRRHSPVYFTTRGATLSTLTQSYARFSISGFVAGGSTQHGPHTWVSAPLSSSPALSISPCVRSLFSARSDLILNRHRRGRVTHPRAMAVAAADDGLTDYERQRLAHVARNREYMARLGVLDLAKVVSSEKPTTAPSRKRVKREPTEPSRRSGRLLNVKPEHDGSAVDALRATTTTRRTRASGATSGAPAESRPAPRGTRAFGTPRMRLWRRRGSGSRTPAR